jgi:hypothetical protein
LVTAVIFENDNNQATRNLSAANIIRSFLLLIVCQPSRGSWPEIKTRLYIYRLLSYSLTFRHCPASTSTGFQFLCRSYKQLRHTNQLER